MNSLPYTIGILLEAIHQASIIQEQLILMCFQIISTLDLTFGHSFKKLDLESTSVQQSSNLMTN
jgi:hypothetical protein